MAQGHHDNIIVRSGVDRFARHPVAGAILLLSAAVLALVWANSAWSSSYFAWLGTTVTLAVGEFALSKPAQLWINDGLMALFFFVVGLEIKREFIAGALRTWKQAAFPLVAALGGMLVPALVYVAFNAGTETVRGWGVPMATDIAFALGVLAVLGSRVPVALKVFLTAVAIVDDIGAITVIAMFYSDTIAMTSLALGFGLLAVGFVGNRAGVRSWVFFAVLGIGIWLAFLKSGVHATLAAVLLAFVIPARTTIDRKTLVDHLNALTGRLRGASDTDTRSVLSHAEHHTLSDVSVTAGVGTPLLQRLEHAMAPFVTLVVLPVFALANAGVAINAGSLTWTDPVLLGVMVGLVLGNPIGILGFSWMAVRLRIAQKPDGLTWRHVLGVASLAGIGFTMSVFISGLAFVDAAQQEVAKIGILSGSLIAGVTGSFLLLTTRASEQTSASAQSAAYRDTDALGLQHGTGG